MCVHNTKSSKFTQQCRNKSDLDLCDTHLANVQLVEVTDLRILSALNSKVDPNKMSTIERLRVVLAPQCGTKGRYFVESEDHTLYLLSHFYVDEAEQVTVHPEVVAAVRNGTVMCGACRKAGVAHPYHDSSAEVRHCYATRRA